MIHDVNSNKIWSVHFRIVEIARLTLIVGTVTWIQQKIQTYWLKMQVVSLLVPRMLISQKMVVAAKIQLWTSILLQTIVHQILCG